jgi:hypothetical protein
LPKDWLRRHAFQDQRANAARTFVVCPDQERRALGYYSHGGGSRRRVRTHPEGSGSACHSVMVLARLAVDIHRQGKKSDAAC